MTRRRWQRVVVLVLSAALSAGLVACGGGDGGVAQDAEPNIAPFDDVSLPDSLLGLRVGKEDIGSALAKVRRTYVDESALFALRSEDQLVQATLQVNRFEAKERYRATSFQRTIVNQLGTSAPVATRMGSRTVWRTTGANQMVAVWFDGRVMYLLAIRGDFDRPRSLIRELVEREQ